MTVFATEHKSAPRYLDFAANTHGQALDMVLLARVEKSRTCYRAPGRPELSVVVDTVAGLGSFVEVEIVSDRARKEVAQELEETERLLNLDSCPVVTLPYRDLVLGDRAVPKASFSLDTSV